MNKLEYAIAFAVVAIMTLYVFVIGRCLREGVNAISAGLVSPGSEFATGPGHLGTRSRLVAFIMSLVLIKA